MLRQLACLSLLALMPQTVRAQGDDLGRIEFPNSGAAEAQEAFLRGALLLHSFEYADAAEAFREAQEADPNFALAYWGEAMTHSHPIWEEDDPALAREALERLAPDLEGRLAKAGSAKEKDWLRAVDTLFGEGERMQRNRAHSAFLAGMYARYPDDLEVASFYALSILGTSENGRQIPVYMRAAAIAEEVYRQNPRHPGALHYAIHSYDDPVHAPLGLRMARTYAEVAPAAQHALHMPSHIFVALGMWEESVASNIDSAAAADERRERKGLGLDARGYHALLWLLYSEVQLGRFEEARALLGDMIRDEAESGSSRTRYHLITMRAAYLLGTEAFGDEEIMTLEVDTEGQELHVAAAEYYTRGVIAVERGDLEAAEEALLAMQRRRSLASAGELATSSEGLCCRPPSLGTFTNLAPGNQAAVVMEAQLDALVHLARGATEEAEELFRESTRDEDAMGFDFGPPAVVKPAHELFGEVLLAQGRPQEALAEFQAALLRAPRRAQCLIGLARGAAAAGETDLARTTWDQVEAMWHGADANQPVLREAAAE